MMDANARALPDQWQHRTAERSWTGTLDGKPLEKTTATRARGPHWLHVLRVLTWHDYHSRYRAQALGVVWSLLNPLVMMAILSLIFSRVFHSAVDNFPIFMLIGTIVWQWVSSATSAATNGFVHNAEIVKRTVFPRQLLPVSMVLSYAINFGMESLLLFIFIPIFPSAFKLSPALLLIPVLIFALALLLTGIALMVSVLNVLYRDVAYLVQTGLMLLYWLTPVIYPYEVVPEPYQTVLKCSPLGAILSALRNAVMHGTVPSALGWASIWAPTLLLLGAGWLVFRHYERLVLDYV